MDGKHLFAVVASPLKVNNKVVGADEIRKLAEMSAAQSKNIYNELKEITGSIGDVVKRSRDAQNSFEAIVNQLNVTDSIMGQIDNAMTEQSAASSDMKGQSASVNEKSVNLRKGIEDVQNNMSVVSQVSEVILSSMDEMAAGSQQISSSSQSVSELAKNTRENIQVMDSLLRQFTA